MERAALFACLTCVLLLARPTLAQEKPPGFVGTKVLVASVVTIDCQEPGRWQEGPDGKRVRIPRKVRYMVDGKRADTLEDIVKILEAAQAKSRRDGVTRHQLGVTLMGEVKRREIDAVMDVIAPLGFDDLRYPNSIDMSEAWQGRWVGTSGRSVDGRRQAMFRTELGIRPLAEGGGLTWTLIYGRDEERQERNYQIRPGVRGPDHFVIDERNGILLDTYLRIIDDETEELLSRFDVMGNVIEARYTLRKDTIEMQLTTFTAEPVRESGGEGAPKVQAYRLKSVQRALLRRS